MRFCWYAYFLNPTVLGFVSALTLLLQNRYKQKKAEDIQVKELVAISLAKLQDRVSCNVFELLKTADRVFVLDRNTFTLRSQK
jgi:hypothetical protein